MKKLFFLLIALSPISAKILIVPYQYQTLQQAIYASRCHDTIMCDSVPDAVPVKAANKVLFIIGVPRNDSPNVLIRVPVSIEYSKCYFKKIKIVGTNGNPKSIGSVALSISYSQIEIDSSLLIGGGGGANDVCGKIRGGVGLISSNSSIKISNSKCIQGAYGTQPGSCVCFPNPCPPAKYYGIDLRNKSLLEKIATFSDSILIDSTSALAQSSLALNYDCIVFGPDSIPFTDLSTVKLHGAPGGIGNVVDVDTNDKLDIVFSYRNSTSAWGETILNQADWSFSLGPTEFYYAGSSYAEWVDLNNDGILDCLTGYRAGKKWFLTELKGRWEWDEGPFSAAGDFNNDGKLDVVETGDSSSVYKTYLWKNNLPNQPAFVQIPHTLPSLWGANTAWGDYDKDGDLDLLLSSRTASWIYRNDFGVLNKTGDTLGAVGNYGSCTWGDIDNDGILEALVGSNGYKYLNGHFAKLPFSIPGMRIGGFSLGDYDNDGDIDIFSIGGVFRNDRDSFVNIGVAINSFRGHHCCCGDFDNDGDLDFCVIGENDTKIFRNNCKKRNTPPSIPQNLKSVVSNDNVLFSWNSSSDIESPSAALSYELRVGTTPGGCNVMSTKANLRTNFRKVPGYGNVFLDTLWKLTGLLSGTYYWSVQAIDNGWLGSAFAPEQSFNIGQVGLNPAAEKTAKDFRLSLQNGRIVFTGARVPASYTFTLYNITGQMVYRSGKNATRERSLFLGHNIRPGLYLYLITNGNGGSGQTIQRGKIHLF